MRRFDRELIDETEAALRAVEQAVRASGHRQARAHTRGQLLSAVAFSMALAGCSRPLLSTDGGRDAPGGDRGRWNPTGTGARPRSPSRTELARPIPPTRAFDSGETCSDGCGSTPVAARFDSDGRIVAIDGVDGGTLPPDVVACLLGSLSGYCYPNLAGTTQTLTGHCWIA